VRCGDDAANARSKTRHARLHCYVPLPGLWNGDPAGVHSPAYRLKVPCTERDSSISLGLFVAYRAHGAASKCRLPTTGTGVLEPRFVVAAVSVQPTDIGPWSPGASDFASPSAGAYFHMRRTRMSFEDESPQTPRHRAKVFGIATAVIVVMAVCVWLVFGQNSGFNDPAGARVQVNPTTGMTTGNDTGTPQR
jgi:hypothetical protein